MIRKYLYAICFFFALTIVAACGKESTNSASVVDNIPITAPTGSISGETSTDTPLVEPTEEPTVPVKLSDDFWLGADVSMLIAQENSDVKYYDNDGNEADLLKLLADNDVNLVRIRVWNDPYDEEGNGYGGGNCDIENALKIGKRATEYGIGVMVDFHYSDFWADPKKQMRPKAWEGLNIDKQADALYVYTYESLEKLLEEGVDVKVVQIGNETTTGMSGRTSWIEVGKLMNSGAKAVRELSKLYDKEIKIAIQFTNPEKKNYLTYAKYLADNDVDYDIFASSYYPFWHGSTENLTTQLKKVVDKYDKEVMVAEISYVYTYEDGDGTGNSVSSGEYAYEISPDGQIQAVSECVEALLNVGEKAVGVCYWEPAWIPVPADTQEERAEKWEKYGSGWASSYSAKYDPYDAGKYYGGSAWDNQAWFDFEGRPLKSLETYKIVRKSY